MLQCTMPATRANRSSAHAWSLQCNIYQVARAMAQGPRAWSTWARPAGPGQPGHGQLGLVNLGLGHGQLRERLVNLRERLVNLGQLREHLGEHLVCMSTCKPNDLRAPGQLRLGQVQLAIAPGQWPTARGQVYVAAATAGQGQRDPA